VRTRLLNVALLAALALAVSRLWLFLGEPPPSLPAITRGTTLPQAAPTAPENKPAVAEPGPEAYDVIVARDLFSSARGVVPPAPVTATKPAAKPQPPPKLTLSGVVIIDGERTAYLQEGTQDGRPRKVRENESFANGVVKAIRPDGITFLFAGSEINVPLRIPKDGAGASSPGRPETGNAVPRSQAPVTFPRRQVPPGAQQGQTPAPGRPASARPGTQTVAPPTEPGGEVFEEEEFPEEFPPGGEVPDMPEEEVGE